MLIPLEEFKNILLQLNLTDEATLYALIDYAKNTANNLDDVLIEKGIITDEQLGQLTAQYLKLPYIKLTGLDIDPSLLHIVPEKIARRNKIMVFGQDQEGILVAMADPSRQAVLKNIEFKTGLKTKVYYATYADITTAYTKYQRNLQKTLDYLLEEAMEKTGNTLSDAPIEKIVDLLFRFAYSQKASDIHIELEERNSLVRFRIDGILHDVLFLPKVLHDRIITRIKVMSRLRTDEHLSAQDGKLQIGLEEENLDVRVSILPMVEGEKACLRLLSTKQQAGTLIDLGMREDDYRKVMRGFSKSFGMVLSTGPTGSGKSTSIYSILKILNVREKNITTIEDPVEYRMRGLNQIPVNNKTGLTFANGLRSILRQDPNIIFVGEIRDNETAGIAVNAALTGHLVLSTLHTNDAAGALPRLIDMHVEPFLVASTVNTIMAQRLVRKICNKCIEQITLPLQDISMNITPETLAKYFDISSGSITAFKGKGCEACHFTGYRGRIGLYEVLEVTKAIRELIVKKMDSDAILVKAKEEGMTTMLDDGLIKVTQGITTVEEVLRVTKVDI